MVRAISTPLASRSGFLIRSRTAFELSHNIQAVVFDKTSTLAQGSFGVKDTLVLDQTFTKEKILSLAASLETNFEYPIAKGIIYKSSTMSKKNFKAPAGEGVQGDIEQMKVQVVSPRYFERQSVDILIESQTLLQQVKQ